MRLTYLLLIGMTLGPAIAWAAQNELPAREVWSGTYRCGPAAGERGDGFNSRIDMLVEGGQARIIRESANVTDTLSGRVAPDGTLALEGTGSRRDGGGPGWRYRFDGRIDGGRYEGQGAMLTANLTSRLRECSMSLRRVLPPSPAAEPAPPVQLRSETRPPSSAAEEGVKSAPMQPGAAKPRAAGRESIEKEIDFRDGNDAATMEGTVSRGAPHRFLVNARRGQTLHAALKGGGARFDLYEPGSNLTILTSGFVVQGSRLGATADASRVEVELPADGKYLLLVRPNDQEASYALELKVEPAPASPFERWVNDERVWIAAAVLGILFMLFLLTRRKRDRRLFRSS